MKSEANSVMPPAEPRDFDGYVRSLWKPALPSLVEALKKWRFKAVPKLDELAVEKELAKVDEFRKQETVDVQVEYHEVLEDLAANREPDTHKLSYLIELLNLKPEQLIADTRTYRRFKGIEQSLSERDDKFKEAIAKERALGEKLRSLQQQVRNVAIELKMNEQVMYELNAIERDYRRLVGDNMWLAPLSMYPYDYFV
jgi:hypothetical protein